MNIGINEISESDYNKLKVPVLFEDKLIDRVFGLFSNGVNEYKFGWQSTIIKPEVTLIDDYRCSVGIDLIFIIFEINTGKILVKISLNYFYYDTKTFNGNLYVITELEIIKLEIVDLKVVETYSLPDFFVSIKFYDENIVVQCINDEVIKYSALS